MKYTYLELENKISIFSFSILEDLYKWNTIDNYKLKDYTQKYIFDRFNLAVEKNPNINLKVKILYERYCILIKELLEEYCDVAESERHKIIDYYLWNNKLKELNCIGLSWYYDYKFKKSKATIYKGRFKESNWDELRNSRLKDKKGASAMKGIIDICRRHINKGNEDVQLKSFSKCFGTDLFKYVALYKHDNTELSTDLYIKKDADINVLKTKEMQMSVQEFIYEDMYIKDCDFILDFSMPRDMKRENFDKWHKNFMDNKNDFTEDEIIDSNIEELSDSWELRFYQILMKNEEYKTKISRRISPIADSEVIVSGDVWGESVDFKEDNIIYDNEENILGYNDYGKCIHFNIKEEELYRLIYLYYQKYAQFKKHVPEDIFKKLFIEYYDREINAFKNYYNEKQIDGQEIIEKLICIKEYILDKYNIYSKKLESIISFIDWNEEKIKSDWSYKNIYKKDTDNLFVNAFKEIALKACITICEN